jgi:hypothetical protein
MIARMAPSISHSNLRGALVGGAAAAWPLAASDRRKRGGTWAWAFNFHVRTFGAQDTTSATCF